MVIWPFWPRIRYDGLMFFFFFWVEDGLMYEDGYIYSNRQKLNNYPILLFYTTVKGNQSNKQHGSEQLLLYISKC